MWCAHRKYSFLIVVALCVLITGCLSTTSDQRSVPSSDSDSDSGFGASGSASSCGSSSLTSRVPRQGSTLGSQIASSLPDRSGATQNRHCRMANAMSSPNGGVPNSLRNLVPVQIGPGVTICVMPDYMSFGTDADSVRAPLGRDQAVEMARDMGFMLPTTSMVDAIYRSSSARRLTPSPETQARESVNTFVAHSRANDGEIGAYRGLVAGHRKDLVADRVSRQGNVSIYGWQRGAGNNIQDLHSGHNDYYADYSHGVRFVSQTVFINGENVSIFDVMTNPQYAQYRQYFGNPGTFSASDLNAFNPSTPQAGHGASNCFTPRGGPAPPRNERARRVDPDQIRMNGVYR